MGKILGILIIILGIAGGIYFGVWFMLAGGIFQIIEAIQNNWEATGIVWGVIRIVLSWSGWLIAWLGITVGTAITTLD